MNPTFIKLNGTIVNLSMIVSVRPAQQGDTADYVVNLAGTRQIHVYEKEGKPLWEWLDKTSLTTDQLASSQVVYASRE